MLSTFIYAIGFLVVSTGALATTAFIVWHGGCYVIGRFYNSLEVAEAALEIRKRKKKTTGQKN